LYFAASATTAGALSAPSATERRSAKMSFSARPWPSAAPSDVLREVSEAQVSTRSPRPQSPESVSAFAPMARPKRVSSAKPRVMSAARAPSPSLRPSATPPAMAMTFFTAPPISAPIKSSAT
jgi:hypothetical protein